MKRVLALVLTMLLLFSTVFCVFAAETGTLTLGYFQEQEKIHLAVTTNQTSGVGGLDIQIEYDPTAWQLIEGSAKTELKSGDISESEGTVRLMWFTIAGDELSTELLKLSLKKVSKDASVDDIAVTVKDYYDQALEMNNLPYDIQYTEDETLKPSGAAWLLWLLVPAAAAAGCFVYMSRKKRPARRPKPQMENWENG